MRRRASRLVRLHVDPARHVRHAQRPQAPRRARGASRCFATRSRGSRSQNACAARIAVRSCARRGSTLLQCQPHDTLCGCSVDAVARAMAARLEDVEVQSAGLREDALFDLIGYDAVATRAAPNAWTSAVVVCNPAARARGGVAEVEVLVGARPRARRPRIRRRRCDADRRVAARVGARWRRRPDAAADDRAPPRRVESPQHYPWDDFVESTRALVWVPPIAGYGTRSLRADRRRRGRRRQLRPIEVRTGETLDGERRTARRGRRAWRHPLDARAMGASSIASLLSIESITDAGDLYTPSLSRRAALGGVLAIRTAVFADRCAGRS